MTKTDVNNILTVKRRAIGASAVQFTGRNGGEIVAFVKEYTPEQSTSVSVKNGGSYVLITDPGAGGRARKGDWVVLDVDEKFRVFHPDLFAKLFLIKG